MLDICTCNGSRSVIWCRGYTAPGGPGVSVNVPGVTLVTWTLPGNTLMQSQLFVIITVAPLSVETDLKL